MKKRKLVLSILASVMIIILVMSGCSKPAPTVTEPTEPEPAPAPAEPAAPAEVIELKFSHPYPPISPHVPPLEAWGKQVDELTEGRVQIVFYPAGTLVDDADQYPALLSGVSDIAIVTPWRVPELEFESICNLPFLGWTDDNCLAIRNQLDEEFAPMSEVRSEVKTMWLMGTLITGGVFNRTKEIHVPDDVKGMKFISPATMNPFWEACGATAVGLVPTDFYAALEKGVVDGIGAQYMMLSELRLDEVINYNLEIAMAGSAMDVVMNLDRWNSLPADVQGIMESTFADMEKAAGDAELAAEQETRDRIMAEGKMQVVVATPEETALWSEKAVPMHQVWIDTWEEKGYPAQEAYDKLMEIIARY
jgi:TRAP-type C4-dicarboxylate transport system substrate-binding protein